MTGRTSLKTLTALKGLFILIIAFHNTTLIHPVFTSIPGVSFIMLYGGKLGNSMFFLLSGFLLSYNYLEKIMSHAISFPEYLMRRLKKLYPMYFITNLAALILAVVQYGLSVIDLKKTAFTFLMQIGGGLENGNPYNSPTWFVSTLLLCYIAFYFIAYRAKSTTQYYYFVVLGIVLGYGLMKGNLQIPFCYLETGVGLMNFSIGAVLAAIYPSIREKIHKILRVPGFVMLLLSLFLIFRYGVEIICGDVQVAFAFVICPLIIYLAVAGGICSRILQWKGLVFLGKMSVSIFFWHLVFYNAVLVVYSLVSPGAVINEGLYLLYFALMVLWSYLSYRFLEPYLSRKLDTMFCKNSI